MRIKINICYITKSLKVLGNFDCYSTQFEWKRGTRTCGLLQYLKKTHSEFLSIRLKMKR